jgi:serine phosphatase RsbU (regulator of sigma subunit)/CBS domain-containing protein
MDHSEQIFPHLGDITKSIETIRPETTVNGVVGIFQKDQALLALPVVEQGQFQGVINRRTLFFQHLGKPFAMELYGKTPIRELMDEHPVTMEPDRDVSSALKKLLEVDPALTTDSFPVVAEGHCLGIVPVSDLMMRISESQATLLEALQNLSARIREEVAKASRIQQDLLPPGEGRCGGIAVSAEVVTSSEIGGDFYDYFPIGESKVGFVVADVSGHGVQSGMVTTAAKASLHTLIAQGITTPAELLRGMNNAILATARQTLLMTCLIAVIDQQREELTLANAGHNFPYVYREQAGTLKMINDVAGYPLGFEENCAYDELTVPFPAGSTLFLYTDGIVECHNREGEEFGYGRLEAFLYEEFHHPPQKVKKLLLTEAARFVGAKSFEDDVTLLIARFNPCPPVDFEPRRTHA